jgi:hypothetical protein
MDLILYGRVLWRFRLMVAAGLVLGFVLAVLSFYSIGLNGGKPSLTPRKQQVFQVQGTILLTLGRNDTTLPGPSYGSLTGYAPYFARLANGDTVKQLMRKLNGGRRPEGDAKAVPAADTTYGNIASIPGLSFFGTATSPGAARKVTSLQMNAFSMYFAQQQTQAELAPSQRVNLRVVQAPEQALLIVPRKKTLPIVVFLAIMFVTIALAFVLENARPGIRVLPAEERESVAIKGVRRSA